MLAYARETVARRRSGTAAASGCAGGRRSALLRALGSSPAAAAATLREPRRQRGRADASRRPTRSAGAPCSTRPATRTPRASTSRPARDRARTTTPERRSAAAARRSPARPRGLAGEQRREARRRRSSSSRSSSSDGFNPIVFCRFIPTADYVADAPARRARQEASRSTAVTGTLAAGRARGSAIAELGDARAARARRDRLPQRGHQPPGRTSTPSSTTTSPGTRPATSSARAASTASASSATPVRVVTYYGADNQIDGIVLDVLLRKHQRDPRRRSASRCRCPVDTERGRRGDPRGRRCCAAATTSAHRAARPASTRSASRARASCTASGTHAAEREKRSRTVFAQHAIKPDEVAASSTRRATRSAPAPTSQRFVTRRAARRTAAASPNGAAARLIADLAEVPRRAARRASATAADAATRFELRPRRRCADLDAHPPGRRRRSPPTSLDTALDPHGRAAAPRAAASIRTRAVATRTTLLLVRFRFHLTVTPRDRRPARAARRGRRRSLAFAGAPDEPDLARRRATAERCSRAEPDGNVAPEQARELVAARRSTASPSSSPHLDRGRASARRRAARRAPRASARRATAQAVTYARRAAAPARRARRLRLPAGRRGLSRCDCARPLFQTIRTEGGLLPADLLQRIADGDTDARRAARRRLPPRAGRAARRGDHPLVEPAGRRLGAFFDEARDAAAGGRPRRHG